MFTKDDFYNMPLTAGDVDDSCGAIEHFLQPTLQDCCTASQRLRKFFSKKHISLKGLSHQQSLLQTSYLVEAAPQSRGDWESYIYDCVLWVKFLITMGKFRTAQ